MEIVLSKIDKKLHKSQKFNDLLLNGINSIIVSKNNYYLYETINNINDFLNIFETLNYWWKKEACYHYPFSMYDFYISKNKNFDNIKISNDLIEDYNFLITNIVNTQIITINSENFLLENNLIIFDLIIEFENKTKIYNIEINKSITNYEIDILSFLLFSENLEKNKNTKISTYSYLKKINILFLNNYLFFYYLKILITFFNKNQIINNFNKIYLKLKQFL